MPERQRTSLYLGTIAAVLYFSEGLPFGIVKDLIPLYLRVEHVELRYIGLASSVSLAWTLKFLWSPLIDSFGTYRRWIAGALVGTGEDWLTTLSTAELRDLFVLREDAVAE